MNNSKKNIHNSGPLGMLMQAGQIKKMEGSGVAEKEVVPQKSVGSYFKTQTGLEFVEQELMYVDPSECEPWIYANRQDEELGDIEELILSIKTNKQLQPALIRLHPAPHGKVKYEIIFGRRRHMACTLLNQPLLVIRKTDLSLQDAIACQNAENKLRNDVSAYSDAILYQRLLLDRVFKSERELAEKLQISTSSFNDLMAFAKIPHEIVQAIPKIHQLSKQMAVKIVQILNKSEAHYAKLLDIAPAIGVTINSQAKLEKLFETSEISSITSSIVETSAKIYSRANGRRLFTFKFDYRGLPSIVFNKEVSSILDFEEICHFFSTYLEDKLLESEYSD